MHDSTENKPLVPTNSPPKEPKRLPSPGLFVAILLLICCTMLVGVTFVQGHARDPIEIAKDQLCHLRAAVRLYHNIKGHYPATLERLHALQPLEPLAFKKIPNDPWGQPYLYKPNPLRPSHEPTLLSFGPDRRPGGDTETSRDIHCE